MRERDTGSAPLNHRDELVHPPEHQEHAAPPVQRPEYSETTPRFVIRAATQVYDRYTRTVLYDMLDNPGAKRGHLLTVKDELNREQLLRQLRQSWQRGEDYETFAKNEYRLQASTDLTEPGENATTP